MMGGNMQEIIELESKAVAIDTKAQSLIVKNQGQYDIANDFLKAIKGLQQQVKDTFGPIITKAYAAHKEAKLQETIHLEPLIKAETLVKDKMLTFWQDQERIRLEAERKLQEAAEKKRQEALDKAEAARDAGNEAKAEKYEDKAAQIVAPQLAPTFDKGSASMRKYWSAEVLDLMVLVKAVAKGQVSIKAVKADLVFLNSQAESLKETFNYPGVKAVSRDGLSTRIK